MTTPHRAVPCPCGNRVCTAWHVEPLAAVQCVRFSKRQARAVAALLNEMERFPDCEACIAVRIP